MWGPGPWMAPMWGFWWIFPVSALLIFLLAVIYVVQMFARGGNFTCMEPRQGESENNSASGEVGKLREPSEKARGLREND